MRVGFLTGEFPPMRGGVGDYTARIASTMGRMGNDCHVVTSTAAQTTTSEPLPFAPHVWPTMSRWNWQSLAHLRRVISDVYPDLINLQYQTGAFAMSPAINILPLILGRRARKTPFVVTCHDIKAPYLFPKAGLLRWLTNRVLFALSDATIVTNEQDLAQLVHADEDLTSQPFKDRLGRRSIYLIPIGSNIDRVELSTEGRENHRQSLGIQSHEVAIGFFGFIDSWKGVEALIEAYSNLRMKHSGIKLVFVGGKRLNPTSKQADYQDAIEQQVRTTGYESDVLWTGFADAVGVSHFLQCLDICALPFVEGACYRHGSLMAAIEHRLSIVTTKPHSAFGPDVGAPLLPLRDGENALLVAPGDVTALGAALERLIVSPSARERLRTGVELLAPQFSWESIARSTLRVYEHVVAAQQ